MRYALYRFKGEPPKESPCGMSDLVGIGDYANPKNALRWLRPSGNRAVVFKSIGYTHYGLYTFPRSYNLPMELVHTETLRDDFADVRKPVPPPGPSPIHNPHGLRD